jgi:uncharacterized phosphosugar-binding protein
MIGKQYASDVLNLAQRAVDCEYEQIQKIASVIFESLKEGGVLHVFGCGHSHMFMEECFYRAGGIAPVNPLFETSTMLHEGAVKSSLIERMSGYAPYVLNNYDTQPGEVILIFSQSGINSFPIEMAISAKEKGLITVAFSSMNYRDAESRHPTGEKLCDVVDYVVNNHSPYGDAMVTYEQSGVKAVPSSTVLSVLLLNMLISEIIDCYDKAGLTPPAFVSGNVEGGMERNKKILDEYKTRVKAL